GDLSELRQKRIGIISFPQGMPRLFGIHLVGKLADGFHTATVLLDFGADSFFEGDGRTRLIFNAIIEPFGAHTETIHPVACRNERFHEALEAEVAEQFLHSDIAAVDLASNSFTRALACEVDTALLVENRERRIDAKVESVLTKKNSAETVDGRDRS